MTDPLTAQSAGCEPHETDEKRYRLRSALLGPGAVSARSAFGPFYVRALLEGAGPLRELFPGAHLRPLFPSGARRGRVSEIFGERELPWKAFLFRAGERRDRGRVGLVRLDSPSVPRALQGVLHAAALGVRLRCALHWRSSFCQRRRRAWRSRSASDSARGAAVDSVRDPLSDDVDDAGCDDDAVDG